MSKYASLFLLSAPEYHQISDKLRLRKYGSWLASEAWMREDQGKKRAQFTLKTVQLARKIAAEKNIDEAEAFDVLQGGSDQTASIFEEYAQETSELMAVAPSNRDQFEDLVTLFFRNRGQVLDGKKWIDTGDWSKEDTGCLPKILLDQVEIFMTEEDDEKAKLADQEEEEAADPK